MEGILDMIYTAPNGEIIDTETGQIIGYVDFQNFPPLSTDAHTLFRHFDGVSTEELGTGTAKVIAISRAEERLLMKIRPFEFFKMGLRSDYRRMLDKINRHKLHLFRSILLKNRRADPDSVYNSILYRETHKHALARYWSDPESRVKKSVETTLTWIDRRIKFGSSGFSKRGLKSVIKNLPDINLWELRRERYGPAGVKNPEENSQSLSEAQQRRWANGYTHPPEKIWKTRRERFGPTGHDPEIKKEADKRGWETRRARYGQSGRKLNF